MKALFVAWADFIIAGAAFVAGVYFADVVKKPVMAVVNWVKSMVTK
jgi:hypothetical protein